MEEDNAISNKRRWLVPEVVQTSAMDCGPAVLKCLLGGYGIAINYGRLREACQTDLDGTSIDTLESVANRLGLVAEQVMLPADQVLLPESKALPAILIVRLPDGATHFVLIWRRHGSLVQVMDPAVGRRWISSRQLIREMYVHRQQVPADDWREWAVSDEMLLPLQRRLCELGLASEAKRIIELATDTAGWQAIAQLDAVVRLVHTLVRSGSMSRGSVARQAVLALLEKTKEAPTDTALVPDRFWSVRALTTAQAEAVEDPESLWLRGAVLIRVGGRRADFKLGEQETDSASLSDVPAADSSMSLNRELHAALQEPDSQPLAKVWSLVRQAGRFSLVTLFICLAVGAICLVAEALLLRSVLDLRRDLAITPQRLLAIGGICLFGVGLMLLEYGIGMGLYRLGRRLEIALRIEFLSKIPRLHDRYFQSRPTSDMAERGHALHQVRFVPQSAGQFLRASLTIALTAAAIAWLEPGAAWLAFVAAATAITLPILFLPMLQGLDLRVRTHVGALTRFTFDALLGLAAVRAHVAEQAIAIEHEALLVEWAKASYRLLRWRVLVNGVQAVTGISLAAFILITHAGHAADATGVLLLAYWALNIPNLGEEIAMMVHQYPSYRNVTLRLLEPLGAPDQESLAAKDCMPESAKSGIGANDELGSSPTRDTQLTTSAAAICLESVNVQAGGHEILRLLDVEIPPQSHLAIVGPSGAGKSSLVGLLLGWHRPATGRVMVDGEPLEGEHLTNLRRGTVWVDPAVQLWNRSLLENVLYGNADIGFDLVGDAIEQADLYDVLQRLPEGLQTRLGDGGGLLSGGEGQRVKFGRGIARQEPRLVILDEPFRGLERHRRHDLLQRARQRWKRATLICITHDVSETLEFPRVLVLDGGRLVEDAAPAELAARSDSLYSKLLSAEDAVRDALWGSSVWRRIELQSARVREATEKGSK